MINESFIEFVVDLRNIRLSPFSITISFSSILFMIFKHVTASQIHWPLPATTAMSINWRIVYCHWFTMSQDYSLYLLFKLLYRDTIWLYIDSLLSWRAIFIYYLALIFFFLREIWKIFKNLAIIKKCLECDLQ